jgi:hypothetical protein
VWTGFFSNGVMAPDRTRKDVSSQKSSLVMLSPLHPGQKQSIGGCQSGTLLKTSLGSNGMGRPSLFAVQPIKIMHDCSNLSWEGEVLSPGLSEDFFMTKKTIKEKEEFLKYV